MLYLKRGSVDLSLSGVALKENIVVLRRTLWRRNVITCWWRCWSPRPIELFYSIIFEGFQSWIFLFSRFRSCQDKDVYGWGFRQPAEEIQAGLSRRTEWSLIFLPFSTVQCRYQFQHFLVTSNFHSSVVPDEYFSVPGVLIPVYFFQWVKHRSSLASCTTALTILIRRLLVLTFCRKLCTWRTGQ